MVNLKNPDISVAPMMDWTDRHCRYFLRLLAPHVRLYTEMVTTGALIHGDRDRHLAFSEAEHPLALQLGGSDPAALALCAKIGEDYGYREINLNCGCPSDRVQNGAFGACLMKNPATVADCVAAMSATVKIPVTVKCRIGVDECDEIPFLMNFIETVKAAGCKTFIIHARKAWLNGLSPKENREVPPLRYDIAAMVKDRHPELHIILNGGITTCAQIAALTPSFDGVMIGREAYQNPYTLAEIEEQFWGQPLPDRAAVALAMIPYIEQQQRDFGTPVKSVTRHLLGLYQGQRGGKAWRRVLSTEAFKPGVRADTLIRSALAVTGHGHNLAAAA
ncbi:MAG: tRNA dihydrouridine(20/20a) synthase DusA [Micavibrio sp.]